MAKACIAIGSNLGRRSENLDRAVESLGAVEGVRLLARSRNHQTDPEDCPPGEPKFLNGALLIETDLEPRQLLAVMIEIETSLGRPPVEQRSPRSARIIDLDLLLYDDESINDEVLTLPHPRMHLRRFVLEPLSEIAPDFRHPLLNVSVAELLSWLDACVQP